MKTTTRLALIAFGVTMVACGATGAAPAGPASGPQPSATDRTIAQYQARLRANPNDGRAADTLAAAYLQKVRENGDPSYYPKTEALLTAVLARDPADAEATTLTGTLALARHQFRAALDWGGRAHTLNPDSSRALGVIGDAEIELGQYPEAAQTLQTMVDLRPDLSSYARVSYLRELHGDVDGAIEAMREAAQAGGPVPENAAYTQVLLGNLFFGRGQLAEAEDQYHQSLQTLPDYAPALAATARLQAAMGRLPEAISTYRRVVAMVPLPENVIALGDVYSAAGDSRQSGEQYDLAEAEQTLFQANGVDLDSELALYSANHARHLDQALVAARRATQDRPGIHSWDVLAWTLYQTGEVPVALEASRQALRLGTRDALLYFHAGMIEARLGQVPEARRDLTQALALNPHFSILEPPIARDQLTKLGGQP